PTRRSSDLVILLELLDACVAWRLIVVQACHDGERVIDQTREFGLVRENQRVDLERGAFSSAARLAAFPFDLLRNGPVATAHLVDCLAKKGEAWRWPDGTAR